MPITEDQDLDRLDAIKRWHIFNRDPTDEHWQNIDCLINLFDKSDDKRRDEVECTEEYYKRQLDELEQSIDDRLQALRDELETRDNDLQEMDQRILALQRRADYLEKVARAQAELIERTGKPNQVATLEKAIALLDDTSRDDREIAIA